MLHQRYLARIAAAALACSVIAPGVARAACTSPTVTAARVIDVAHDTWLNDYDIAVTITNTTGAPQPGNTLQFVDIFNARSKLDARGVPPLAPGGSYTTNYTFKRSADAGDGTTVLTFFMDMRQPVCAITQPYKLRF